jgi:hypothetical protein
MERASAQRTDDGGEEKKVNIKSMWRNDSMRRMEEATGMSE